MPGVVVGAVLGVVVVGGLDVGGVDVGGGGASDTPACGAGARTGSGSGAGGGAAPFEALLAAAAGGVVTAGAEGVAVVGTGFASECADPSVSFITAVTDPKPTRNADTQAIVRRAARPPIFEETAAGWIDSRGPSSRRSRVPSASRGTGGSFCAPSGSSGAIGSVASFPSPTALPLTCVIATIELSATDPLAKPEPHATS